MVLSNYAYDYALVINLVIVREVAPGTNLQETADALEAEVAVWAAILSSQTGSQARLTLLRWHFGSPCCPAMLHAGVSATHGCP
eukprot:scaffold4285_cov109-Isochrysis_galbana.AAC.1